MVEEERGEIERNEKSYLTCLKSDEFLASVKRNPWYLAPIYSEMVRVLSDSNQTTTSQRMR